MMGSGKSTIGRLLSESTGWPLYDNDELLARLYGKTPRELLAEGGNATLRSSEDAALELGLEMPQPCIVDAAGGTILSEHSRDLLEDALVVWLRADSELLFARAVASEHRPFLDAGPDWFRTAAAQRNPLYESVADLIVETDELPPKETVEAILTWLRPLCPDA